MLRRATNDLSIKPKWSTDKKITVTLLVLVSLVLLSFGSYWLGYTRSSEYDEEQRNTIKVLSADLKKTNVANRKLTQELATAQRQVQVEQEAYKEINKAYKKVEQKNEVLSRRVNFYRSIVSPEDGTSGVKIHDIRSKRLEGGQVEFELTLIQSINHEKQAKVNVVVELYESKQAKKSLSRWPDSNSKVLQFRSSDVVKGALKMPEQKPGMVLKIIARPDNNVSKQLVEWHEL